MSDRFRSHRLGPPLLVVLLAATPVHAQIVTDGSVGPKVSLTGGEIKIGADLGTRRGDNLFHSFEKFGIAPGQTATFTGPGTVKNVISRVTGGEASSIDGTLASTVGQADLYFLNPAGVVFGPNAKLDVPGSFHVSTAHELRFANGTRFSAVDMAGSGLTVAPPEAFGFLDRRPGQIKVDQSELRLAPGKVLSLVGGDIDLAGGTFAAAGEASMGAPKAGVVFNTVSVASPGEVRVSDGAVSAAQLGSVRMADQRIMASGNGGGLVRIRAGTLTVGNSTIEADNTGDWVEIGRIDLMASNLAFDDSRISASAGGAGPGGTIAIKADNTMTVRNSRAAGVPDRRGIHSDTRSPGDAGAVNIQAGSLMLSGSGAVIKSDALAGSTGKAGSVAIRAGTLELYSGGYIGSDTFSRGPAGLVAVQADRLLIDGAGPFGFTGLTSSTLHEATGDGGAINVTAGDLELRDGGTLNTSTFNRGNAGKVTVDVTGHLKVAGYNRLTEKAVAESRISSRTQGYSTGQGGAVQVTAGTLDVRNGGVIDSDSNGTGLAGSVIINADRLTVANPNLAPSVRPARISSRGNTNAQGSGNVEVTAHVLELHDGGTISTTSLGTGQAGQITVTAAGKLLISGTGAAPENRSGILSRASLTSRAAGTVSINAGEMEVSDDGEINTESSGNATGGPIVIKVTDTLRLDNATISVTSEEGSGGDILIKSPLIVLDNSKIIADAKGGSGGNIFIDAGQLIRTPDSVISASGTVNGNITITAPDTDVSSSLIVLPETFLDASSHLREACATRGRRSGSSFTTGGRGGLPLDPGAPLIASPFGQSLEQQTATGAPMALMPRSPQVVKPITVSGIPQPVLGSPRLTCRG